MSDIGGMFGFGDSSSESKSSSSSSQNIDPTQLQYLSSLWSQGLATLPGSKNYGMDLAGKIAPSFQGAYGAGNPYSTAASGLVNPLIEGLTGIVKQPGATFAEGGNNPLLDKNVALALEQASTNLKRNVLPSISRDAQAAGQFGGSRQDIATGLALSDANKQALQTAMGAYGDQYSSDRAANLLSQSQNDATRLGAAQIIQDLLTGNSNNVSQGALTGQQLQNTAYWNPLMNYAQILGQPVVLGESQGTGSSSSGSTGVSGGFDLLNLAGKALPFFIP